VARAAGSGTRADIVLFAAAGFLSVLAIILPANVRRPAAAGLRRTLVAPLVALQRRAEMSRNALLSHEEATNQRDSLALRALSMQSVEAENERLRRLLGLGQRLRWGFVATEALHASGSEDEFTITLTAGADAGVRSFSPVIAPEGLVGMVQTVDPTMSLAITWSNPDFRASAMTVDGSAFGIVSAHLGSGADRYLMELRGVPFRNQLAPRTLVVTSGLGGVYPAGIPIGTVLRELKTSEGWARTYLVQPIVLPSEVNSVMILRPARVDAGVKGVWTSTTSADSAARRIVAAADSIASDSARAAARRRAADSARVGPAARAADSARSAPRPPATRPASRDSTEGGTQRPATSTGSAAPAPRPDSAPRAGGAPTSVPPASVPAAKAPPAPDTGRPTRP
jgi:rod shape-determining protein MreC